MKTITLDIQVEQKFDKLPEIAKEALARTIELTAQELWGQTKQEAPVDHGRLAGSFTLDQISPLTWRVSTDVEYAMAVHEGTPPHTIYPVEKKALYWPGAAHPVKKVNHPGTAGNPYGDRAIDNTEGRLDDFAQIAVDETLQRYEL